MRVKKATGDDGVPGDVLKLLGRDGLRTVTHLINSVYETGERPKDFSDVTVIALTKKPKAKNCSDCCTISLIIYTANTVAMVLKRRIERNVGDVLGNDQFEFRRI